MYVKSPKIWTFLKNKFVNNKASWAAYVIIRNVFLYQKFSRYIESIPQYTRQRHGSQNNFIYCWNSIYVIGVVFILLHDFNNIIVIHIRFV